MARRPVRPGGKSLEPVLKGERNAVIASGESDLTTIRTLRCRTVAKGRFQQLSYIRDLPPQQVADDKLDALSELSAPNASEALLAAFGSCLTLGIHANAVAQRIPIRGLELELEADINTTAVWGTGDLTPKPLGFDVVRVVVHIEADASPKTLGALIKHATLWSPVANTLHNPVHLDVVLAPANDSTKR